MITVIILCTFIQVNIVLAYSSDYVIYRSSKYEDSKLILRYFCASLKHYLKSHLYVKAQEIHKEKMRDSSFNVSYFKFNFVQIKCI